VEHPNFEGHMMPNNYQKICSVKI